MKILQVLTIFMLFKKHVEANHIVEIPEGYDRYEKPSGIVKVNASMNLRNIIKLSEKEQIISLKTTLRMFWRDERLNIMINSDFPGTRRDPDHNNLTYLVHTLDQIDRVWMPDLFVDEAISVRKPAYKIPTESLRFYEDGSLRFSHRFNFDVGCTMDFSHYPVDVQDCIIKLESFSFTEKDLVFTWLGREAMRVNPDIQVPHYDFKMITDTKYKTGYYSENYAGLEIRLHLVRKMYVHILQDFLPSFLYVWIAYFAIQMPPEIPQVRAGLVMFPMLTLTTLSNRVRSEIPAASVLTIMDVWLLGCLIFIFSCMVVIVISAVLVRNDKEHLSKAFEFWFKIIYPIIFTGLSIIYAVILINKHMSQLAERGYSDHF